ncbi:MAG: cytochrome c biogenesis protein DipZ [Solirubrobacteraceae bacterium]|nr:cytochrome c biogenesis protein DipZ [Solirubrobacteraceae bacterium]
MILLLTFAFLAGAATAITPCVLPVLPALLSASGTGGRRRPAGIVAGLTITHVITIVGVASVVDGVGVGDGTLRTVAIAFLALFGVALLVPGAAEWITLRLSFLARLAAIRPRRNADGFWSGLPVGGALGFVYAPCAGPILAAVISVSASSGTTAKIVAVATAYGLGSAVVLLGLALGGRRLIDRVRRRGRGAVLQRGFGAVMVLTAVLMFTSVDLRFQEALASRFPSFLTNPTGGLEKSAAVQDELAELRGRPKFDDAVVDAIARVAAQGHATASGTGTSALPVLGRAPEFAPAAPRWWNSAPLTRAGLRGRVVLVDFWTYTCINCLRTLPYLKAWDARYRTQGLTIVGVHTPEFAFERRPSNVGAAIGRQAIRYPVVQDNEYGTWNAFGNQYWPAKYLVDARGRVRYVHFGEGEYEETEAAIRALLREAGRGRLGATARPRGQIETVGHRATPETYLGSARAKGFSPVGPQDGTHDYTAARPAGLPLNVFSLGGRWRVDRESARAVRAATITARVFGGAVYLVLASAGDRPRRVRVELDGRPIRADAAGDDVRDATVTVRGQRLYNLVRLDSPGEHVLALRFDRGVSGFAFTFG